MKCELCNKTITINWGDSRSILCEDCAYSEAGKKLLNNPDRPPRVESNLPEKEIITPVKRSISNLFLTIFLTGLVLPAFLAIVFWVIRYGQGVDVEPLSLVLNMAVRAGFPLYIPFILLAFLSRFVLLRTDNYIKWYYFFTGAFIGLTLAILTFLSYVMLSSEKIERIVESYVYGLVLIIPLSLGCTLVGAVIGWIVANKHVGHIEHSSRNDL